MDSGGASNLGKAVGFLSGYALFTAAAYLIVSHLRPGGATPTGITLVTMGIVMVGTLLRKVI